MPPGCGLRGISDSVMSNSAYTGTMLTEVRNWSALRSLNDSAIQRNCSMVRGALCLSHRDGYANSMGAWSFPEGEGRRSHLRAHSRLIRDASMCVGSQKSGPLIHQPPAPLEKVAPGVGCFR